MNKKILIVLMFGILMVSLVGAFDFDNVKSYDEENEKINIINAFGLGKDLVEYKMTSNTDECYLNCETQGTGILYTSGKLFDGVKFLTKNNKNAVMKSFQYWIFGGYETKERDVCLKYSSELPDFDIANGEVVCLDSRVEEYQSEIWNEYNFNTITVKDIPYEFKWRMTGSKNKMEDVDFIPSSFGVDLDEWVWWFEGEAKYIYVALETNKSVTKLLVSDWSYIASSPLYPSTPNSIDGDDDYIYMAGEGSFNIWKLDKEDLSVVETSLGVGASIYSIKVNDIYVYIGAQSGHVTKYLKSDLSLVDNSSNYGGAIRSLEIDDDYVYVGGDTNRTVWKLDKTDLSFVSNSIFLYNVFSIVQDDNFIYVGGATPYVPNKIFKSNMSIAKTGGNYGDDIRAMEVDENYVYASGDDKYVVKYDKTDMSFVVNSSDYGGVVRAMKGDDDYLFIGGSTNLSVWKLNKVDMSNNSFSPVFAGATKITSIVLEREPPIPVPSVVLNTPTNYTNQTTKDVIFNCTAYDDSAIINVSFYLNGVLNETNATGINNSAYYFTKTLSEGKHYWTCEAHDDEGASNKSASYEINMTFYAPNITLHYPVNLTNSTSASIHFNATVWDDIEITNVSFILNNAVNETDTSGLNNSVYGFDVTLADGYYNWTIRAVDSYGNITTAGVYNFSVDTLDPVVSASNLTDLIATSLPTNSSWGYTASDTHIDLCYYNTSENATYEVITCNETTMDLAWTSGGNKTVQFCANDTFARETCNTEYIWVYSLTETQADNPDPIGEGSTAVFNFTINLTDIATTTATLMINNSIYSPTITTAGTNGYYFEKSLVIPDTWGNTTGLPLNWSWNYTIAGITTNASTTIENITIYELAVDNCTLYSQVILNLSLRDEEGNSVIDTDVYNSTVEVEIVMASIVDPSITIEYSYTFNNESSPQLCVPLNLINDTNYTADITVGFDSTDHVWEFWHLDDGIISIAGDFNDYTDTNVNLMDLLTTDSTSFLFNYFDLDGQAVDGSIAHVFRKYIGDGIFLEVERSQADENGDTIVHLVEEDVIYYFEISLAGVILYTSSTYTALCQAVPCTIDLEEGGESAEFDTDYDLIEGGGYSITDDVSTRIVTLSYELEDPATINFTLYRYESDGSYVQINTSVDTDTSGILPLYVPQSAGNVSFFASVVKDDQFINSEWVDFSGQAVDYFGTVLSLFFGAILILTLGLMAVSTGAGVLIWVMVGIVVSGAFGLFATKLSTGVSVVIYLICAGALLLWKLTGGRK